MKFRGVAIDPYTRTLAYVKFKEGRGDWLKMMLLEQLLGDNADSVFQHMHYALPMDAISGHIGGGEMVPIFVTPVAPDLYLVLHDDVRDQDTEREAFVIAVDGCILDPQISQNMHWERAVLIRGNGKQIPSASFQVEWSTGCPRVGGGGAVTMGAAPGAIVVSDKVANPVACGHCGSMETIRSFKKCAQCFGIAYCSRKCQKLDWKHHKPTCAVAARRGQ